MKKFILLSNLLALPALVMASSGAIATDINQSNDTQEVQTPGEKVAEKLGRAKVSAKHNIDKAKRNTKEAMNNIAKKTGEAKETTINKMHELKDNAAEKIDDLKEAAGEKVQEIKDKMQDLKDAEDKGENEKKEELNSQA